MAPSSSSSSSSANTTSVQVAVRIRPLNKHDEETIPTRFQRTVVHGQTQSSTVSVDPSNVPAASVTTAAASPTSAANNPLAKKQTFTFDQVHPQDSTQYSVFTTTAAPLVARFLQGFNCTVLAYGQTSSGKTYTMTGVDLDADPTDPSNGMGIIPRAISTIFQSAEQLKKERGNAWNYSLKGSYIEIYNEDLIDLLGVEDATGGRREVQIREDKDGNIIWGGLREVNVKSTGEVMTLIKHGSSLRRTNETDMNAQSSRSHAIFSLTLTQKKYTGTTSLSPPPRASGRTSPSPMGTPSPSRLARPASVYASVGGSSPGRVGSPTFGRPPTPSFAAAMGRASVGGGMMRPSSAMGMRPGSPDHHEEQDQGGSGSWVTVVSKFHFVDLAGSERLKRTAAQGERIKEGISINSGLLALGNVISALGDPSRARSMNPNGNIHVPYRDSKLTRLLQDSLGGNAHTLMIACCSPVEWNAVETVNTLKYANRARNIKNRAEVKEKEEGWEDVEWLQGMVTKLRKEVKSLKEGGGTGGASSTDDSGPSPANSKMMAKYNELQNMHEELRTRYSQANEELRSVKLELDNRPATLQQQQPSRKYEDIVAPVIEQYEKTIAAMEAELKLNRTALAHTNEMFEEQEAELEKLKERHSATEAYTEELRARIARLVERESSTEVYVRDLEAKLKTYAESSSNSAESINDLKKELAKHKENDQSTAGYIADLEARLSRSDLDSAALKRQVESLESQLAKKVAAVERLESKIDTLLSTKSGPDDDIEAWKATLEERERKVAELERRLEEWEKVRQEAGEERERLGSVVGGVERQRRDLEDELKREEGGMTPQFFPHHLEIDGISVLGTDADQSFRVPSPSASLPVTPMKVKTSLPSQPEEEERLVVIRPSSPTGSIRSVRSIGAVAIKEQLSSLQETHSKALTELSDVTVKYRDALKEINELNSRLTEIKNHESGSDGDGSNVPPSRISGIGLYNTGPRRRMTRDSNQTLLNGLSSPPSVATNSLNSQTRRLFFRNAASADSLHSRSQSQSQSQESSSSPLGLTRSVLPRDSYSSWSMSGGGERDSLLSPTLTPKSPRMSLAFPGEGQRSVDSYEKEILRLQEVLKERESEITILESNLNVQNTTKTRNRSSSPSAQSDGLSTDVLDLNGGPYLNGTSVTPNLSRKNSADERLSPKTRGRFAQLRQSIEVTRDHEISEGQSGEETMTRLNELMRSMAQKESSHKVVVDDLNSQLEKIRKQHDELTALSRDQALNMSTELEALRLELHKSQEERTAYATKLEELKTLESQLIEARRAVDNEHATEIEKILKERDEELAKVRKEQEELAARTADEHEDAIQYTIAKTRREAEVAANSKLDAAKAEHEEAQARLRQEHEDELRKHEFEVETLIARTRADHERLMNRLRTEQEEAIRVKEAQIADSSKAAAETKEKEVREALGAAHANEIKSMQDAHAKELADRTAELEARIADIRKKHSADLEKVKAEHAEVLARVQEEAAATLKKAQDEHETALTKAKSEYEAALAKKDAEHQLQMERDAEEHAAELRQAEILRDASTVESASTQQNAIQQLQVEHAATLKRKESSIRLDIENLKSDHAKTLESREADHKAAVEKLNNEHTAALEKLEKEKSREITNLKSNLDQSREEQEALALQLAEDLSRAKAEFVSMKDKLLADHEQTVVSLKAEHQQAVATLQASLVTAQQAHQAVLEESRTENSKFIEAERQRHTESLAQLDKMHATERDTLRKAHDLVVEELSSSKSVASTAQAELKQSRTSHQTEVEEFKSRLAALEQQLASWTTERANFASETEILKSQLSESKTQQEKLAEEASKRESLEQELQKQQSLFTEVQADLQKVKDEKEALQAEKTKQDGVIQDLKTQLAAKEKAHKRDGSGDSAPHSAGARVISLARANALPPAKLPPLTPPPAVPPPPLPISVPPVPTDIRDSSSSQGSHRADSPVEPSQSTPSTSAIASPIPAGNTPLDQKITTLIEEQARHLDEQEAMIKTLNKQLTHCESDLQAHMDLVATLEASLTDSERNLRKARMQSNELAKERDSYQQQCTGLRMQLAEAQREVTNVRKSVVEEKMSLERSLEEERKAKERARAQLDSRMEELTRRKSKFVCL